MAFNSWQLFNPVNGRIGLNFRWQPRLLDRNPVNGVIELNFRSLGYISREMVAVLATRPLFYPSGSRGNCLKVSDSSFLSYTDSAVKPQRITK
jgi:hypothetical protein